MEKAKGLLRDWASGSGAFLNIDCSVSGSDRLVVRGCVITSFDESALDFSWSTAMTETLGFIFSNGKAQIVLSGTTFSTFGEDRWTGVLIERKGESGVLGTVRVTPATPL